MSRLERADVGFDSPSPKYAAETEHVIRLPERLLADALQTETLLARMIIWDYRQEDAPNVAAGWILDEARRSGQPLGVVLARDSQTYIDYFERAGIRVERLCLLPRDRGFFIVPCPNES